MSKTIGLIDDSRVMRSILRKSILMNNVQVDEFLEADNGQEGYEMLSGHSNELDIAFVDLHMPRMSGVEMLRRLRTEGIQSVPIVIVSTSADLEMQKTCMDLGAVGFIRKPFTPQDIGTLITKIFGVGVPA
ncbi:MAG TPA: response regulator [bacterium]|nr:response regulator [bacterium]